MNGRLVGRWEETAAGIDLLTYHRDWLVADEGRPLSLSLPLVPEPHRGARVGAYFENLIPDNDQILRRIRERFGARSTAAFDLLSEVGRDCAGAIQLVPAGADPGEVKAVDAEPLDEAGVARILRATTVPRAIGPVTEGAFRLSLAGAQEKTALLLRDRTWCVPMGATPSTHLFKLPLGVVGNVQADMRDSVENEWLCLELMREMGFNVPEVQIRKFEEQKVLIVERFDRRPSSTGDWYLRLPQEDFCQALGLTPSKKYETDGGPGISKIMDVLRGSESSGADRTAFFKVQILFWVLAATDGHAKNFSIFLRPQGRYHLTPFYDVLSTHPIQGSAANLLNPREAKLAMAVEGTNRHYRIHEIHRWHWFAFAARLGLGDEVGALLRELATDTVPALERVAERLPGGFPLRLYEAVHAGVVKAIARLSREPDRRTGANSMSR